MAAELLERGVVPFWPSAHDAPYDLLVAPRSRAIKIQVKGSDRADGSVTVKTERGRYTTEDADVVAIYWACVDAWYFIPTSKDIPTTANLRKWDKYLDSWHLVGVTSPKED